MNAMKKNFLLMFAPVLILLVLLFSGYSLHETDANVPQENLPAVATNYKKAASKTNEDNWVRMPENEGTSETTQDMLEYALSLIGAPYLYAGITPAGFDCSGFITHVYDKYDIDVPHSSALQADEGVPVAKHAAAPGDLVIFTGTDETKREPGHVGIVISEPGDTITFVHSSSNGGVKISKVQGTRYNDRFLEVRRIL